MSHAPTVRALRETLLAHSTSAMLDEVGLEALRQDIARTVREIRQSINRIIDFASRGLVGEAAALAEDFPDLAEQAAALAVLPQADPSIARAWKSCTDPSGPLAWIVEALPRETEIDLVVAQSARAADLRSLLAIYRSACLRQESITVRLRILKKLRSEDPDNRMWLDQIQSLEREWLKWATERSREKDASRRELEEILAILSGRDWLASIPRGLSSDVQSRLKPMRAESAGERFAEIAQRIHLASARLDWEEIARLEAEWAGVYQDTGRMPDPDLEAPVKAVFDALTVRQRQEVRAVEFAAICDSLERELDAHPPGVRAPNEHAIERSLQTVRDFGFHAPEGLVERTVAHLGAIREARARRSRLLLLAGLAAASVAAVSLAFAIRIQTRRADEASSRGMLLAHVEAGRWAEAEELAARTRRVMDDPSPETREALESYEAARAEWQARQSGVEAAIEHAERALDGTMTAGERDLGRQEHAQIVEALDSIREDIEADGHRSRVAVLDRRLADEWTRLDERDRAVADGVLSDCNKSLVVWMTPDRWAPAQALDQDRWKEYLVTLERLDRRLQDGLVAVRGFLEGESDLGRKRDEVSARIVEARGRLSALESASRAIDDPSELGRPPNSEGEFIERLRNVVRNHSAVLFQRGDQRRFEEALALAEAWTALEAWRERSWGEINQALGGNVRGPHPPATVEAVNKLLDTYVGDHPRTPLRKQIAAFRGTVGRAGAERIWSPADLRMALELEALVGLERVGFFRSEDRFYYRRFVGKNDNPLHNALNGLGDLKRDPARLGAAILPPGEVPRVPVPVPVSDVWAAILAQCPDIGPEEVHLLLLDLLRDLRAVPDDDPLLKLYSLVRGVELLEQSGLMPDVLARPLNAWQRDLGRKWREARDADWAALAKEPKDRIDRILVHAKEANRSFPDIEAIVRDGGDTRLEALERLGPFFPIGVLLMSDSRGTRRIHGQGTLSGGVFLLRRASPDQAEVESPFELMEVAAVEGVIDTAGLDVPEGPVLVYRRRSMP